THRWRHRLFPGSRLAGHLLQGISAWPAFPETARKFPPRVETWRRTFILSTSLADARFLGVSQRLHGSFAADGDLPGSLQPILGRSRSAPAFSASCVGISRRRRNG